MSISDPIGDLLTRIRNAQSAHKSTLTTPTSNVRNSVLDVLKRQGYIREYTVSKQDNGQDQVNIELKYFEGEPVIRNIKRVSKPGRRVYSKINDLNPVYNGLGIAILSTPKGVMSDAEARTANVGGEVLCEVF
jgi:small subunit ribosomal protein S8